MVPQASDGQPTPNNGKEISSAQNGLRFQVRNRVYPQATKDLIIAGLKSLKYDELAFLDDPMGSFYQGHCVENGYRLGVVMADEKTNRQIFYEPIEGLLQIEDVISVFTSYELGVNAWQKIIAWKNSKDQYESVKESERRPVIKNKMAESETYTSGAEYFGLKYYIDPTVFEIEEIHEKHAVVESNIKKQLETDLTNNQIERHKIEAQAKRRSELFNPSAPGFVIIMSLLIAFLIFAWFGH